MAQYTREKMKKLIKKRKVKSLIKALTYMRGETFAWDKPPSGDKFNPNYHIVMGSLKGHKEYVEHYGIRMDAAKALGEIGDKQAVEPLLEVAENDNLFSVRATAAEALEKLDWQPDNSVAGAVYWVNKCNWDKCIELGDVAVEPLIHDFVWGVQSNRVYIGKTLAKIGGSAVEALIETLNKWLHEYLGMIGLASMKGIDPTKGLGVLMLESFSGMSDVLKITAWALSWTGDERAVEALNKAISTFKGAFLNLRSNALFMGYTHAEFLEPELDESLEKLKKSMAST
ncbi:MAG: HEAT repeat domain-containing protein [Candidatus Aminicenantes bacterium]|nr:HEAT repeat domain-containing protein [Candidatus Aminicenantes bacterium]